MRVGLDASVVIRLLLGEPAEQTRQAVALLDGLLRQGHRPLVSDLVVAEVYRTLCEKYQVPPAEVLHALDTLFDVGEIQNEGIAVQVLKPPGVASGAPGFLERLVHRQYLKDADQMATFDRAAQRLNGVRVLR